jgi:hypothetical protein
MRDEQTLKNLRPTVQTQATAVSEIEIFQNEVLRPILKFQHDLLLIEIKESIILKNLLEKTVSAETKRQHIKNYIQTNKELKYQLLGQITGLLSNTEFEFYKKYKSDCDKRINSMLLDRMISTI